MNGQSLFETDLRGPIAIVMGGESKGCRQHYKRSVMPLFPFPYAMI